VMLVGGMLVCIPVFDPWGIGTAGQSVSQSIGLTQWMLHVCRFYWLNPLSYMIYGVITR
jgi:hypothetical protein